MLQVGTFVRVIKPDHRFYNRVGRICWNAMNNPVLIRGGKTGDKAYQDDYKIEFKLTASEGQAKLEEFSFSSLRGVAQRWGQDEADFEDLHRDDFAVLRDTRKVRDEYNLVALDKNT